MTLAEITLKTMQRLNLTSTEAETRIKDEVNEVYRELVSSMGLETSIRGVTTALSVNGSRYVTFGGVGEEDDRVLKVLSVYLPSDVAAPPYSVLTSYTFDELRNTIAGSWPPTMYAVSRVGYASVEVFLDAEAPDSLQELNADCLLASDTMTDADSPFFPENFHDVLVHGVMAIELDKMEKEQRASAAQAKFEKRSSDLRMFIAKDAYIAIHQGKTMSGWYGTQLIPS